MRRLATISLIVTSAFGLVSLLLTDPASACSTNFDAQAYARQVEARGDVLRLEGHFFVDRVERKDGREDAIVHGLIYGHVVTTSGQTFPTIQTFTEPQISCLIYPKPALDAEGTFFITRSEDRGRFEMLLWEGRYLDDDPGFTLPPRGTEESE